jgi:GxxExxY protein
MGLRVQSPLPAETEKLITQTIGAAIEVHRQLGPGFLESIYQKAMCHELTLRDLPFVCQQELVVVYKKFEINGQRLDLVVGGQLIVELKAVDTLIPVHMAQLISYLKTSKIRAGLLINFNTRQVSNGIKRVVL